MSEPMSGSAPRCPWCSAVVPEPGPEQCPSCGAQLVGTPGGDADIKGLTTLDAEAILRARSEMNRPRNRLLSLLTGDEEEAASAREHQESLAQPSDDVRREMRRLEMEARRTADEAERTALRAAAMAQLGISMDDLAAAEAAQVADGDELASVEDDAGVPAADAAPERGEWPPELQPVDEPKS